MMNYRNVRLILGMMMLAALAGLPVVRSSVAQLSIGTAFTFQGSLQDGGVRANGAFDFRFNIFDAIEFGNPLAPEVILTDVEVTDGVFTVSLDFGAGIFAGDARYIEIGVRPSGGAARVGGTFTALLPRQVLTPAPYTLFAQSAATALSADTATSATQAGNADTLDGIDSVDLQVPTGTILPYAGTAAPSGYALCDGGELDRVRDGALFSVIGIAFGEGDGINTFNAPDLRGQFLRGVDSKAGNDPDVDSRTPSGPGGAEGDNVGSLQLDATAMPSSAFGNADTSHSHTTDSTGSHSHNARRRVLTGGTLRAVGTQFALTTVFDVPTSTTGNHTHTAESDSHNHTISGGDAETRPTNIYVNYIIKK